MLTKHTGLLEWAGGRSGARIAMMKPSFKAAWGREVWLGTLHSGSQTGGTLPSAGPGMTHSSQTQTFFWPGSLNPHPILAVHLHMGVPVS